MSYSRTEAFLFQGFLRSVHDSSGCSESEETGGCQHDDRDVFPLEMLSDLTVITGLTYGLPKPVTTQNRTSLNPVKWQSPS